MESRHSISPGTLRTTVSFWPAARAMVIQQKTHRPVQFELTEQTRSSLEAWIADRGLRSSDPLFPRRIHASAHLPTRQYARMVH